MLRWNLLVLPFLAACMPKADLVPVGGQSQAGMAPAMQPLVYPPAVLPRVGQTFSGTLPFLSREMTLPEGSWRVASFTTLKNKTTGLLAATAGLVQTEGTTLQGVLIFSGNAQPLQGGVAVGPLCLSSDVIWNDVRAAVPQGEQDCAAVSFVRPALWRAVPHSVTAGVMTALDLLNVQPPNIMVSVTAHEANRYGLLDEFLFRNPDLAGIAPDPSTQRAQSAWAAFRLPDDPAKQRFVAALKAQAGTMRAALRRHIEAPVPYVPGTGLTPA